MELIITYGDGIGCQHRNQVFVNQAELYTCKLILRAYTCQNMYGIQYIKNLVFRRV